MFIQAGVRFYHLINRKHVCKSLANNVGKWPSFLLGKQALSAWASHTPDWCCWDPDAMDEIDPQPCTAGRS